MGTMLGTVLVWFESVVVARSDSHLIRFLYAVRGVSGSIFGFTHLRVYNGERGNRRDTALSL